MTLPHILIGCPVKQKPAILCKFLQSLNALNVTVFQAEFAFIDDNDDPASSALLAEFAGRQSGCSIWQAEAGSAEYLRTDTTHYWNEELIWRVAAFKDRLIQAARNRGADGLFLLDSDLLLHPETLNRLYSAEVEIVSEIFWTRWQPDAAEQPQVWLRDEYQQWEQKPGEVLSEAEKAVRYQAFLRQMRTPGLYPVGGLGACTLIRSEALRRGVSFQPIYNLSFWGEDRHFCVRAAALGLSLYVDTHLPALHLYRDRDLERADAFLRQAGQPTEPDASVRKGVTLSMVVRNEAERYLRQVLEACRPFVAQAVIVDDASTDDTERIVREALDGIPLRYVRNDASRFGNEVELRKQQWAETVAASPEWILNLDADEIPEERFFRELPALLEQDETDLYCFRLYDFWSETHYREDSLWQAHKWYRPFLLRYRPGWDYRWRETAQHCGRFPENIFQLPNRISPLRIKHMGWAKPEHRMEKYRRYQSLDPDGQFGSREQYESILEERPNLVEWSETEEA
ncbi:glycosyltransferase [Gorillibacterium sp. sgz500922]|uniref:glycosyltransferase n=1 Tax=Gorillibacterium sp. sgz500922 TaxID=3446694 RepID=UPI003F67780D